MEKQNISYTCYKNSKKIGEYIKNEHNITFTPEKDTTLDDAVEISVSIAKYFQMSVFLSYKSIKINIPYQKTGMPTEQEIINQFKTNKR